MRVGLLLALLAACTSKNPLYCDTSADCGDPDRPFCDVDGTIGHDKANECIAVSCAPSTFFECRGSEALTCDAAGTSYDVAACSLGCNATAGACNACTPGDRRCESGTARACGDDGQWVDTPCALACVEGADAHCAYLEPKYLPDVCDESAALDAFDVTSSGMFDTDLDSNCTGGVVAQTGASALCVVRYRAITIGRGHVLTLVGSRAVAFVADERIEIGGYLTASAKGPFSGPGGGVLGSGGGTTAMPTAHGGGGAGFRTRGGAGGSATMAGGAMNGGAVASDPATQSALVGGPHSRLDTADIVGGGGGGAVTLVACRGTVSVTGTLVASGGGGPGGATIFGILFPGRGGGAGGYFVLQGLHVDVTGEVYANGGGGGAGCTATTPGANGLDGVDDIVPTSGGETAGTGPGGAGGYFTTLPVAGGKPTATGAQPGGGGGSVGFFQTYTPAGVTPMLTPTAASPPFQPNGTIPTR